MDLLTPEGFSLLRNIVAVIGLLYVLRLLVSEGLRLSRGIHAYILAPLGICRTNLRKYGQWAVVTGACGGIGRGYALEMARQGLNVVVISNVEERLQKVAREIKEKHGHEVLVIHVDFSAGQEAYSNIAKQIQDLDIAVLVNNVGTWGRGPEYFAQATEMQLRAIVEVNCQTAVQMTRLVLPQMVEKKGGVIVNLSSNICDHLTPLLVVYAATKMFIYYFSEALRKEYKSKGIIVQAVKPVIVATGFVDHLRPTFGLPNGESFARAAVPTIGIHDSTAGYLSHAIMIYIALKLPRKLLDLVTQLGVDDLLARRQKAKQK